MKALVLNIIVIKKLASLETCGISSHTKGQDFFELLPLQRLTQTLTSLGTLLQHNS